MARANGSTTYLYTEQNVHDALATTSFPYTFDGTNLVFPTMSALKEVFYAIWDKSNLSNPGGGYTCNKGTLFEDLGKEIHFKLATGQLVVKWRLVRQITPQVQPPLESPGLSPVGTIGYTVTYSSYGINPERGEIDPPSVIRVG